MNRFRMSLCEAQSLEAISDVDDSERSSVVGQNPFEEEKRIAKTARGKSSKKSKSKKKPQEEEAKISTRVVYQDQDEEPSADKKKTKLSDFFSRKSTIKNNGIDSGSRNSNYDSMAVHEEKAKLAN